MRRLITPEDAVAKLRERKAARLIAIDGYPCAGKSTLAESMIKAVGAACLYVDDFVVPEADWPKAREPAYPSPFVRHDEFLRCVHDLAYKGSCTYRPFDWAALRISGEKTTLTVKGPTLVEGVCALDARLAGLYDLRFFVESDEASILEAALRRGDGQWAREWREYFLPSTELYMRTDPRSRADYLVAGRGRQ